MCTIVQKSTYKVTNANLTVLIGIPGSGKSTWVSNNVTNEVVISRDTILEEYGKEKYGN